MNLFEKLNRLDDSLVESKRVVKKKKLTESTEQYELSTLVKDSINHLVNDLGKDPMADDFGDDVCADLENNYDIDVPQEPIRYANWCSSVMCEVSRQLNSKEEQLTESMSFSWLDVQNQIALEQQEGKNPFYDDSVAGNYVLELMGKVEKELNVEVVPSVQGGYGNVFIHVGNVLDKSEKIIDSIDFNKFSSDMINLVLEADTENEFVNNYRAEILSYID